MSTFWNRLQASVSAGWNTFRGLIPRENTNYGTKTARFQRYEIWEAYADNEMYSSGASMVRKLQNRLYSNIRAVMNAAPRVVDLFAYYVYVGNIDMEHLTGGAIPIVTDDETIKDGIRQVFKWSNWNALKELFVRHGATYGDSFIKIVDDREHQKVYMEPLHPSRVWDMEIDRRCNTKSVVIQYLRDEEPDLANMAVGTNGVDSSTARKSYTYTEIITKEKFQTFKDGKPFAYFTDANGQPVSEWINEYGFVPVVAVQHQNTGLKWGANAYWKVIRKFDELNDVSSLLHDQIRKVIIPILKAMGISKKKRADGSSDLEFSSPNEGGKDNLNILYIPKDTDLQPVTTQIDIAGVGTIAKSLQEEIEADLPILALQQIRAKGGDLTQPGIEAAYADAIASINTARANYDMGMVRALQMCLTIGGYNGYEGFAGFSLDSYDSGAMEFSIKARPVIAVGISQNEKLTALSSINSMNPALQKVALKELGYADDVIDEVTQAAEEATRNAVRGLAESVFQNKNKSQLGQSNKQGQALLPAKAGA